uniref:Src-like-adaptor 2 n=1 Tax=Cyprinus carpio TaxID=7962 RepID=A0A8C1ZBB6_CYPCA
MGSRPSKDRRGSGAHAVLLDTEEGTDPLTMDGGRFVVVSLYDYPSRGPGDCAIRVGERLNILSDEGEWWKVSSSATGNESYIPSNYTAKVYNRWQFVGLSKQKAEELLMLPHNQPGSFLIRESETYPGNHTLSVLRSSSHERASVKHYRISCIENGWVYISPGLTFRTLSDLVAHYSVSDGLCCTLGEPCYIIGSNNVPVVTGPPPIAVKRPTINWKDVDRCVKCIQSQNEMTFNRSPKMEIRSSFTHPQVVPNLYEFFPHLFNAKYILKNVAIDFRYILFHTVEVIGYHQMFSYILRNISCVQQNKEMHTGLEQLEDLFNETLVLPSFQKLVEQFLNEFSSQLHDLRAEKRGCRGLHSERRPEGGH